VDKAVAMWEKKEEETEKNGYKAVVEEMKEEMTKRTTVGLGWTVENLTLRRMVSTLNLKCDILVSKCACNLNLHRCYATQLGTFLRLTVPGVFAENPNLKHKVIVDKAVAMWAGGSPPNNSNNCDM
jgi:hypothetical protein